VLNQKTALKRLYNRFFGVKKSDIGKYTLIPTFQMNRASRLFGVLIFVLETAKFDQKKVLKESIEYFY
jgi:hypothetical protein